MRRGPDPFAEALESFLKKGKGSYRYTRDDGWSQVEDAWWYFTSYRDFPKFEKQALSFVRGRVLDLGCGAGRHSLYLQRKGYKVIGADASTRVAAISRARGVKSVCVASACCRLPFEPGRFDTVLLLGNNLGICGGIGETVNLLGEIARITGPNGRIIATTREPGTSTKKDLVYWNKRFAKGQGFGVAKFRLDYHGRHRRWVSLALFSPGGLQSLAKRSGWSVSELFGESQASEGYSVVLEKRVKVQDRQTRAWSKQRALPSPSQAGPTRGTRPTHRR